MNTIMMRYTVGWVQSAVRTIRHEYVILLLSKLIEKTP